MTEHHKAKILIKAVIIFIVILLVLVSILSFVKVPYTVTETYEITEPIEELEFYNETQTYEIQVPYQVMETSQEQIGVSAPSDYLERQPLFLRGMECYFDYYDFTVNYYGQLTGVNEYDRITDIGYKDGVLRLGLEICNYEKKGMDTDLFICRYNGDTKVSCNDRLVTHIRPNTCQKKILSWVTAFDPDKNFRLELGEVSQKLLCRQPNQEEFSATYYDVTDIDYSKYTLEDTRLKTKSGYLAIPKSKSYLNYNEVDTATQNVKKLITKYKTETREKQVLMNRTVTRDMTISKTREVTKYRVLWDELKIRWFS